jgi:putative transposase
MCSVLQVNRQTYYNHVNKAKKHHPKVVETDPNTDAVWKVFQESRGTYGQRRIKAELHAQGILLSRRRISRIMKSNGWVSCYTKAKYRPHQLDANKANIPNLLARQFRQEKARSAVVSDLTYVRVGNKWHYICTLLDLFNREIIGYSAGPNKDRHLVLQAFASVNGDLREIGIFHTDRGGEFANLDLDDTLKAFEIARSLSAKACPYDNAVAEATFKSIKTEFVRRQTFHDLGQLSSELQQYVNWFNTKRRHSTLDYMSPFEYKRSVLEKNV